MVIIGKHFIRGIKGQLFLKMVRTKKYLILQSHRDLLFNKQVNFAFDLEFVLVAIWHAVLLETE